VEEILRDAEIHIEVNQNKEALGLLKSLENLNVKQSAERDYLLGRLYSALGKFAKANEFYDLANLGSTEEPKYLVGLAESYFALGRIKFAKNNAEFALLSDPDRVDAELLLAKISDRLGLKEKASNRFIRLLDLQPSSEPVIVAYAKFLEGRVEIRSAIEAIENFLIKHPNSPDAVDYLGQLYWFVGNSVKAINHREQAVSLYENQGRFIYANAIDEWINKNKGEIGIQLTPNLDEKPDKKSKPDVEEAVKPKEKKPRYVLTSPSQLEPFPIGPNEMAYTGSGFIVNNGREVITNRHVVEGAIKIFVRNGLGILKNANIKRLSDLDDLAILSIDDQYDPNYSLSIPSKLDVRVGMDAVIMGYPMSSILGDSSPSLTEGIISKNTGLYDDPGTFIVTSKLNKGNSGGPIFSNRGELLGVAVAKLDKTIVMEESGFIPEDVNIGIKVNRVERMLKTSTKAQTILPELDLADLYEQKLASVVMIVSIYPPENQSNNQEDEYTIEDALIDCKGNYADSQLDDRFSKNEYNNFCECYIYGVAELYDDSEDNYQQKNNEPSSQFLQETERLAGLCIAEVEG